jgi:copper chaperone CopZ
MSFSSITVVLNALRLKGLKLEQVEGGDTVAQTILKVADMDCNHCVKTISTALETQKITAVVDLSTRTVSVDALKSDQALATITKAGYHPVKQTT